MVRLTMKATKGARAGGRSDRPGTTVVGQHAHRGPDADRRQRQARETDVGLLAEGLGNEDELQGGVGAEGAGGDAAARLPIAAAVGARRVGAFDALVLGASGSAATWVR
jgi:hypothetical protein